MQREFRMGFDFRDAQFRLLSDELWRTLLLYSVLLFSVDLGRLQTQPVANWFIKISFLCGLCGFCELSYG